MEALGIATDLQVQNLQIRKASLVFRAINNAVRQKILEVLHENSKMTVTALYMELCLEQSVTSQHLAILRKARLVNSRRDGQAIYYSVNYHELSRMHSIARSLVG